MEQVLERVNLRVVAKAMVIMLTVALLYWGLCALNPALAKSSVTGQVFGKTIRIATSLKALVLVSPAAVVGTSLGSMMFAAQTGDAIQPLYTLVQLGIALSVWKISQKWGRSFWKDLTVLTGFGLVNSTMVALKLTTLAVLFKGSVWGKLLQEAVQFKIIVSTLTLVAGYFIWVKLYERFNEDTSSK